MKLDRLILASASPRRRELIERLGIPFDVILSDVDEIIDDKLSPEEVVRCLAEQKAEAVAKKIYNEGLYNSSEKILIVGADTTVVLRNDDGVELLGKPKNRDHAREMLRKMSSAVHEVMTGVAIFEPGGKKVTSFVNVSEVYFYQLSDDEIESYLDENEWEDKAGAYGIQSGGAMLVEKINGCFYNVIGLPIAQLKRVLGNC